MSTATQTPADLERAILVAERREALWRQDAETAAAAGDEIAHDRCLHRAEDEARAAKMLRQRLAATQA